MSAGWTTTPRIAFGVNKRKGLGGIELEGKTILNAKWPLWHFLLALVFFTIRCPCQQLFFWQIFSHGSGGTDVYRSITCCRGYAMRMS